MQTEDKAMTDDTKTQETQPFQTEVARLLHLMVHAVYTDKEIFLRELISNASDACDKLRYEAIASPDLVGEDNEFVISVTPNKDEGWLEISDNGIGMTADDMRDNLGTIARSGTKAFLDRLKDQPDGSGLIGQFGVGFYSAFMVADQIQVISRRAGSDDAMSWESDGASGFKIQPADAVQAARVPRGTIVRLKLKDDAKDFLEPSQLERIVKTYSDHILFPVMLEESGQESRQLNRANALWQRSKSDVTAEEYTEAYRTLSGQFDEPALTVHYKAEGRQSYAVLLFVPEQQPFDLFDPDRAGRVKLYVRRVYITDDASLLPGYLRFVRGVVDSEDVPLNISREMLQNNPLVSQIRKALTTRVLSELEKVAEKDASLYAKTWAAFGGVLKEGLYEDAERRESLLKLARFQTTKSGDGTRSLAEYVADFKDNQTEIYYLAGQDLTRLQSSPQLEAARAKGVEVLLLTDPIDHYWTTLGIDFDGKPLKSLSQGDVNLANVGGSDDAESDDETKEKNSDDGGASAGEGFVAKLKECLGERVSDVQESKRLVDSAVCLVAPHMGPDLGLEKILSQQQKGLGLKPILEVNTTHALVKAIAMQAGKVSDTEFAELAGLLVDQAFVLDGQTPEDPAAFAKRMNAMMLQNLNS